MSWVVAVVLIIGAAVGFAFRLSIAGTWMLWLGIGVPYLALAVLAIERLRRRGLLRDLVRFRRGDPSIGIALGLVLLGGAWLFTRVVLPAGAAERAWLLRVFLLPGELSGAGATLALLGVVCAEELVWRGWVQTLLREKLGPRRGWVVAAVAYAAVHLPTLFTLEDPVAGKNPLLVLAALGCGLCLGFLAERTGRLLPGLFAHGVFSYFAATSFWMFV